MSYMYHYSFEQNLAMHTLIISIFYIYSGTVAYSKHIFLRKESKTFSWDLHQRDILTCSTLGDLN